MLRNRGYSVLKNGVLPLVLSGVLSGLLSTPAGAAPPAPLARTVRGQPVPTANSLYPKLTRTAGTPLVMRLQKTIETGKLDGVPDSIIVEGPSFFSPDVLRPPPKLLERAVHKAYIWTKWQLASSHEDKVRLRGPATHFANPLLKPDDLLGLLGTAGPDGRKVLLPCDIVVNGIGGIATHVSLYVGPDAATGKPHIIHALGTPATQQSYAQVAGNVVRSAFQKLGKMGVVEEGLGEFFGRFERDTYFVVRDPRMTDAMRQRGIQYARTLVGRGYDYDMSQSNESLYCTEVATEMMKAAYEGSGLTPPAVGTTAISKNMLEEFAMTPDNLLACPDLTVIHASETGWKHLDHVVRTHVLAPGDSSQR